MLVLKSVTYFGDAPAMLLAVPGIEELSTRTENAKDVLTEFVKASQRYLPEWRCPYLRV